MALLTRVRSLLDSEEVIYECRHCGTTLHSEHEECPHCENGQIVAYEIG
jgi:rubrerythrin